MSNAPKTVLCIHDLPGFGRAGLSVIVPVLSALGAQAVAVPTAVLSTHTGGLGTPAKLANPGYGPAALEHYRRLGLRFDCIYSGYLADASQAKLVEQAMDLWPDALTVVDPVMGDHGRMYRGLAPEMVPAMYTLCSRASLILPNTTEAALLLGDPMPGVTGEAELHTAQAQAQRLTRICPRVLITGVAAGRGIACVGADRATGESLVRTPMVPKSFHGTGDIFGAVLVGRLLQGNVLPAAAQAAAESGTPLLLVGGVHDWIAPLHRSSILAHLHALPQAQALLWAEPEHDGHADLLFGATRSEANPALMAQITRFLRPEKFDEMKKSC